MAYIPKILYPTGTPVTGGQVLYNVPLGQSVIIKNIVLTNTTNQEAKVHMSVVPLAGAPSTSNRILADFPVAPYGIVTLDMSLVMPSGAFLHSTNLTSGAITVTVSGVEIV